METLREWYYLIIQQPLQHKNSLFYRTGLVFIAICIGSWLWMGGMSLSPNLRHEMPGHPHPPPSFSSSRLSASTNKLGDVLFPVPLSTGASPWIRDNHLMIQSLFDCLERFDCHANQTKSISSSCKSFHLWQLTDYVISRLACFSEFSFRTSRRYWWRKDMVCCFT